MKIQQVAQAIRAIGVDAKVDSRDASPTIQLTFEDVGSHLIFVTDPDTPKELFTGLIFQTGFPNEVGLTEVDIDEFNAAVATAKGYLKGRTVLFNTVYYIPSSLLSGELFKHLLLVWLNSQRQILEYFGSE